MARITGLTSATKKNLQLDAGALYKGWVMGTDTPGSSSSKLIGATVGGSTFTATPEVRQIAVDGAKGPTKGYETIDSWTATLAFTIKESTKTALALALAACDTTTTTSLSGYSKLEAREGIADTDYVSNIAWVGTISGSGDPIVIILKNVLSLTGLTYQAQDKNEAGVPVTLTAHYDVSNLDEVPFEIYMPDIA